MNEPSAYPVEFGIFRRRGTSKRHEGLITTLRVGRRHICITYTDVYGTYDESYILNSNQGLSSPDWEYIEKVYKDPPTTLQSPAALPAMPIECNGGLDDDFNDNPLGDAESTEDE